MYIKENISALRKKHHLSQEQLAGVLGVSRQAVQKWEAGTANPDVSNLIAISEFFGVTLDRLVKGDQTPADVKPPAAENGGEQTMTPTASYIHIHLHRTRFEYRSKRTLFGLPLVHIHIGGGLCRAKGIFAVGNLATGFAALGGISAGVLSLGGLSLGLLAVGGLAAGAAALGGLAIGLIALGGAAVGLFAAGGGALGMIAIGGGAAASHIAIGAGASGHIAIGEQVSGDITLLTGGALPLNAEQVRQLISQEYPHLWPWLLDLLSGLFS